MSIDYSLPNLRIVPGVTLAYGTGFSTVARYARVNSSLSLGGNPHTSMPVLAWSSNDFVSGGIDTTPWTLVVHRSSVPAINMIGQRHSPVKARLKEYDLDNPTDSGELLFEGRVVRVKDRPRGAADLVEMEIWGYKALYKDVNLGQLCETRCILPFGGEKCGVDVEALKETGTLSKISADRTRIEATGLMNGTTQRYFQFGYVEKDNLRIPIRNHGTIARFLLSHAIPRTWEKGDSIVFAPGCDRLPSTCEGKYNNAERFSGLGKTMPLHHPIIEENTIIGGEESS